MSMAYGKEDFIDFSDLDLNLLLGDFTESEYYNSDSDFESDKVKKCTIDKKDSKKSKLYQCDECANSYSSISGLRGHLRSKHGKQNIKASQYRTEKSTATVAEKKQPFRLGEKEFSELFREMVPDSLRNIMNNRFRNLSKSVNGKFIVSLASDILENAEVLGKLIHELQPIYYKVLNKASDADSNTNESLLRTFHSAVFNEDTTTLVIKICLDVSNNQRVRQFIGILHRQLITDIVENRSKIYSSAVKGDNIELTKSEQSVLMMIGGYILHQLSNKSSKAEQEAVQNLVKSEQDSERNFISEYSEWTKAISRGGLKIPSDRFFLFVRECEICLRKNIGEKELTKDSYTAAKEIIMEDHMVKYYGEKLLSGPSALFVIEKSVVIFLNVRGPAAARLKKMALLGEAESKKSLRKTLQDKTNKS